MAIFKFSPTVTPMIKQFSLGQGSEITNNILGYHLLEINMWYEELAGVSGSYMWDRVGILLIWCLV